MACHLFGAKPLPKPMLAYRQLDSWERILVKFESKFYRFQLKKMHLKMSSANMAAMLSKARGVNSSGILYTLTCKIGHKQLQDCVIFIYNTWRNCVMIMFIK